MATVGVEGGVSATEAVPGATPVVQAHDNSRVDSENSLPSNSSVNHTTLVEEWKRNISKDLQVRVAPTKDQAAARIQNLYRCRKRRLTFKTIKRVLTHAEESITRRVLKQINPSEAHLLNDPSLRSRVRFRLGGTTWPPIILYKIYTNATVRYIDGRVVTDHIHGKLDKRGVYSRRDYQKFISWLDRKPVKAGGRGNVWRPLFYTKTVDGRLALPNPNTPPRRSRRRKENDNMARSLPSLGISGIRSGAGGGVSGSKHLRFSSSRSLSRSMSEMELTRKGDQAQFQRWESSSIRRRPGTTTEAGRKAGRDKYRNARPQSASMAKRREGSRKSARRRRPRSAGRQRRTRNKIGAVGKMSLKGKEMNTMGQTVVHSVGPGKVLTPSQHRQRRLRALPLHNQSPVSKSRALKSGSPKRFSMKSVTSWETVPDAEANELYAWSNALNVDDLDWVKTSPS